MRNSTLILKWSLFSGAIYFFSMSIAHLVGSKTPCLYIYFNVPSYAYQDRIISFLAFGWSAFIFTAFLNPQRYSGIVKTILISGVYAILGLCLINITTNFNSMSQSINVVKFWVETSGLFIYWLWLMVFYFRSRNEFRLADVAVE